MVCQAKQNKNSGRKCSDDLREKSKIVTTVDFLALPTPPPLLPQVARLTNCCWLYKDVIKCKNFPTVNFQITSIQSPTILRGSSGPIPQCELSLSCRPVREFPEFMNFTT